MATSAIPSKPPRARVCNDCNHEIPVSRTFCPHCGRPQLFPNVALAENAFELNKLNSRYEKALAESKNRNCEAIFNEFTAACNQSVAIFACEILRLFRELATGSQLWETYYDLERIRLNTTAAGKLNWDTLRPQAEIELLGSHHHLDKIHYASLSLNGNALVNYGNCTVQLAERMIAHRASCFEGNTAVLYADHHDFSSFLRCAWGNRSRICVSVFAGQLKPSTVEADFPGILLANSTRAEDDRFIEVHVFGPMTAHTFESVRVDGTNLTRKERLLLQTIKEKCNGVHFEVKS